MKIEIMRLEDKFKICGYQDIINANDAKQRKLDINYLYDHNDENEFLRPTDLLHVYISKNGDELFLVLNEDEQDIQERCIKWDQKLEIFSNFASEDRKILELLKYNMIQIVLYAREISDYSDEGSLKTSRKIFIHYTKNQSGEIEISEDEALKLPFYDVKADDLKIDFTLTDKLKKCIPSEGDKEVAFLLTSRQTKINKKNEDGVCKKSFSEKKFESIREWIESNDN
jgi:hypothetical protein